MRGERGPPVSHSRDLAGRALDADAERVKATATETYDTLTGREREVLRLAAERLSAAEIAASLGISPARRKRVARAAWANRAGKAGPTSFGGGRDGGSCRGTTERVRTPI